jgi:hypothetical protein
MPEKERLEFWFLAMNWTLWLQSAELIAKPKGKAEIIWEAN